MSRKMFATLVMFLALTITSTSLAQRPDPNSPHVKTLQAFARLLERAEVDVDEAATSVLARESFDKLKSQVIAIRKQIANNDSVEVMLESETSGQLEYAVGDNTIIVEFQMTAADPVRISTISVLGGNQTQGSTIQAETLTWDNLEEQMDQAAKDGFEGAILVTRDGEIVFEKGYGLANQKKQIANTVDMVFAIGSQPIDFTHVAILQLKDQGKLNLDDPISKYIDSVPQDKRAITIRHLMTGASGFPDFHGRSSDENQDHAWIDRDEAVKRMLEHELLFEPGKGNEHSHSAWGMLAVIVETVSGESYQDYTRKHLFEPSEMKDTGFFGDKIEEERVAIGYGELKSSDPNSPPNWGKTSWLVMGSGGQVSTLVDILKWERAVKDGKLLSPESTRQFLSQHNGLASDGDMFGFEFVHSYDPDSLFLLISNTISSREERQQFMALGRRLHRLISNDGGRGDSERGDSERDNSEMERPAQTSNAKYSLGIEMRVEGQDVTIARVIEGSAAQKDGLKADDRILSINGQPITDDPLALLDPSLQSGDSIEFVVERDGEKTTVRVKPLPRNNK